MTGCQLAGKETAIAITINGVHVGDRVKFQVQVSSSLVRLDARLILLKLVIYSADKKVVLLGFFTDLKITFNNIGSQCTLLLISRVMRLVSPGHW